MVLSRLASSCIVISYHEFNLAGYAAWKAIILEAWILFTIGAAFLQNIRNSLQKSLNNVLSTVGAAYTRFAFGLPLAIIYWATLTSLDAQALDWNAEFWWFTILGGTSQIMAMWFTLRAFALRGFAVGTAYSKTETFQTAIFTIILLGEAVSGTVFLAIAISFVGVCFLSLAKSDVTFRDFLFSWTRKAALMGLGSGAMLGISGTSYRGGALALGGDSALLAAATTLMVALAIQTVLMTAYLHMKEKGELANVWRNRHKAFAVGIVSMMGSVGWFTAMTLISAAHVRVLGQVELIFTFFTSVLIFKEKITSAELFGTLLIVGGLMFLLLD